MGTVIGIVIGIAVVAVFVWAGMGAMFSRRFSYSELEEASRSGAPVDDDATGRIEPKPPMDPRQ